MSLYLPNLDLRIVTFFFFSSRRRHTRSDRDWSSDVCSSDLELRRLGCREELYLATAEPTQLTGDPLRRRPAVGVVGRVRRHGWDSQKIGELAQQTVGVHGAENLEPQRRGGKA